MKRCLQITDRLKVAEVGPVEYYQTIRFVKKHCLQITDR